MPSPMSPITCTPRSLPRELVRHAADLAFARNPANRPPIEKLTRLVDGVKVTADFLAIMRGKYWGAAGVRLTVGFLDDPSPELRRRILAHMNAWRRTAQIEFVETDTDPDVRIARDDSRDHGGYWSYVGTDILAIERDQPTMNLESFTMDTPDAEFHRVVRHEAGHTLGFVHEHMRSDLVKRIDEERAIAYFKKTQGWSAEETRAQVLTPIENSSLIGNPHPDPDSIMCYQLPEAILKPGEDAILGGTDITASDYKWAGKLYPRPGSQGATTATFVGVGPDAARTAVLLPSADPAYVAAVLRAIGTATGGD